MYKYFLSSFGLLLALLAWEASQAQQVYVTVTDDKTGEPVPFAHVCFESIKGGEKSYCLTSMEGMAPNAVKSASLIAISYMGYETFKDTILPGKSMAVKLKPTILNMDEVVVTAQYTPERVDRSIYKVNVINAREIDRKAATNMAELLKDEVNMKVNQSGVLGTSLSIQGMSGNNVKFLMDGVPLIGRMNGNFDLNQLSLYNVDHVEIIEGPMSVIYGSNALAGVINLITKENKYSTLNVTGNFYTESVGVYNFDAGVSSNLKKHIISFDGGRNFFDGYSFEDTSRVQTFKPRRQYFFDGYYVYSPIDALRIKLSGNYFNEKLQDKGPLEGPYYETAYDSYYTTERYIGRADLSWNLPRFYFLSLMGSWSGYTRIKTTYKKDLTTLDEILVTNPEFFDTTGIDAWVARGTLSRSNAARKLNYQAGFDINIESGEGKRITGGSQSIGDYAAFVSAKWDPIPAISIQPGLRFIYNTKYKAPLVYAISAKWNILPSLSFRGSYSRGFRSPEIKELYLYFVDVNHNVQGNPDLKAEHSNNINLVMNYGLERRKTAWGVEGTFFYNIIDNIITLGQSTTVKDLYTYINLDRFKTLGGTLGITFDYYPSLTVTAGIAETGRLNYLADSEVQPPEDYFYTTDLNSSVTYRIMRPNLSFSLNYKYTGKVKQVFVEDGNMKEGYIGSYNMMDFTVIKGFWENRVRLSAGVKNIFNVKDISSTGIGSGGAHGGGGDGTMAVGWGRTIFAKISINFNKLK